MAVEVESLTIHGISRVLSKSSRTVRTFWSVLLLTCVALASAFVYQLVTEYLKYETIMSVTATVQKTLPFPVVTICNGLRMYDAENRSVFTEGFDRYVQINGRFCQFGGQRCVLKHLKYIQKPNEKSCLVFNPNETVQQSIPMFCQGLTLDFFLNRSDITTSQFNYYYDPRVAAAKVYIHSAQAFPFLINNQLLAKPGHVTKFVIRKVKVIRKEAPYVSNCTSNKSMDYFPGNYSLMGCMLSSWSRMAYQNCGFIFESFRHFLPFGKGERIPYNDTCFEELDNNQAQASQCECRLPCYEEKYEVKSHSETKWPLEPELTLFKWGAFQGTGSWPDDDYIHSQFGRIQIGYDDFEVVHYEEQPKFNLQKLLSDFGGLIGIYLGASFISFAELFVVLMSLLLPLIVKVGGFRKKGTVAEVGVRKNRGVEQQPEITKVQPFVLEDMS